MYLLYRTENGKPVSIGSVLAEPIPAGLTVRVMSDDETVGVLEGRLMWDSATLAFVQNPNWTAPELIDG